MTSTGACSAAAQQRFLIDRNDHVGVSRCIAGRSAGQRFAGCCGSAPVRAAM
jgi:hypothetical protein